MGFSRKAIATGGALLLVLGVARAGKAITLTGLTLFSTDSSGNTAGGHYWNTVSGDISYNLWVGTGSLAAPTLINASTSGPATVNLPLTAERYTFNLYGEPGEDTGFVGLNLFFNGNSTTPGISALIRSNASPSALAINRGSTFTMNINPIPGAGSLSFNQGQNGLVTLTSAYWQTQNNVLDIVAPYTVGPSGAMDFIGQFSLTVGKPQTSIPEPSSLAGLLALGLLGIGVGIRHQRKQ